MRIADIKIGECYKVGYYGCGRVLETRLERTSWRGGKARKDGVKVHFDSGYREGEEMIVSSREIEQPWSEHQAAVDARELQRKIAEQDHERMIAKMNSVSEALSGLGIETHSCEASYAWGSDENYRGSIEISEEAVDRLMEVLGSSEAKQRASKIESSDPLAELLV